MSFYAIMSGQIKYKDQKSFDEIIKFLTDNKWIDKDGYFLDEEESRIEDINNESHVDFENRVINIPETCYRNLSRHIENFFKGDCTGKIVWASDDGCFDGGFQTETDEQVFYLEKWAKENMDDKNKIGPNPDESDEKFDEFCEWRHEVIDAFLETYRD